jgi:hypothetical protein
VAATVSPRTRPYKPAIAPVLMERVQALALRDGLYPNEELQYLALQGLIYRAELELAETITWVKERKRFWDAEIAARHSKPKPGAVA